MSIHELYRVLLTKITQSHSKIKSAIDINSKLLALLKK